MFNPSEENADFCEAAAAVYAEHEEPVEQEMAEELRERCFTESYVLMFD